MPLGGATAELGVAAGLGAIPFVGAGIIAHAGASTQNLMNDRNRNTRRRYPYARILLNELRNYPEDYLGQVDSGCREDIRTWNVDTIENTRLSAFERYVYLCLANRAQEEGLSLRDILEDRDAILYCIDRFCHDRMIDLFPGSPPIEPPPADDSPSQVPTFEDVFGEHHLVE